MQSASFKAVHTYTYIYLAIIIIINYDAFFKMHGVISNKIDG